MGAASNEIVPRVCLRSIFIIRPAVGVRTTTRRYGLKTNPPPQGRHPVMERWYGGTSKGDVGAGDSSSFQANDTYLTEVENG